MTTQGAIFNYEEVIDLHTEVGRVSVIGLHTPTGSTPRQLCPGFFQQFKRYKYLGCSVSVVPVATLPADPLSVSYEAGEPTMDPRDLANPMMFHGCHGNDLGNILNRLYSAGLVDGNDLTQILRSDSMDLMNMFNSDDDGEPVLQLLESLYYRALTDNTWKKAHIQRGFRKSGLRPRIYSLATNMQIQNAGSLGGGFDAPGPFQGDLDIDPTDPTSAGFSGVTDPSVNPIRYFTPRTVPLGWLDTRQVVPYVPEGSIGDVTFSDLDDTIAGLVRGKTIWNELPKIFMGVILMPPAYKTEQYFRVIINHAFAFKGFRGISMSNDMLDMPPNYENWNDLLSDDENDPDPPEPDPDPPVPPTPDYPRVQLFSASGSTVLTRASYYRDADDTNPSQLFVLGDPTENYYFVNPENDLLVLNIGDYRIGKVGSDVVLAKVVAPVSSEVLADSSAIVDAVADLLGSDYFARSRGTDIYEMFLTTQIVTTSNTADVSNVRGRVEVIDGY